MNPFEEENDDKNTNTFVQHDIEIWLETYGRKKNTFISGWTMSEDEFKSIKKANGCNGSMKKDKESGKVVIQFQGDIVDYVHKYLINAGVEEQNIRIKG